MLVKCPKCGAHVPAEVTVEAPVAGQTVRFCSLGCAQAAEAEAARQAALPPLPEAPKRILVPVDGSGPSLRATELAATLARLSGGRVTLLHAIDPRKLRWLSGVSALADARLALPPGEVEHGLRKDAEVQLDRCRRVCEAAGVPVAWRIEVEPPLRAIVDAASDADLIVMGSRGRGALSGAALGSLSHRVLGETRKSVVIVH
ncbi:MAG: universal stress protein [Deltaproteobacteria bacterium]|nr:universal stress protein [Deltaproteobacteria bacterium]